MPVLICSPQLYNAYVEAQDQLLLEKLENKRINKYLDEIVQEVEAKAPILKRQREEYERSQKAVASLSGKLEQAMKVSIKLKGSSDTKYNNLCKGALGSQTVFQQ